MLEDLTASTVTLDAQFKAAGEAYRSDRSEHPCLPYPRTPLVIQRPRGLSSLLRDDGSPRRIRMITPKNKPPLVELLHTGLGLRQGWFVRTQAELSQAYREAAITLTRWLDEDKSTLDQLLGAEQAFRDHYASTVAKLPSELPESVLRKDGRPKFIRVRKLHKQSGSTLYYLEVLVRRGTFQHHYVLPVHSRAELRPCFNRAVQELQTVLKLSEEDVYSLKGAYLAFHQHNSSKLFGIPDTVQPQDLPRRGRPRKN